MVWSCSIVVSCSGHVHVLLDLKGNLREKRDKPKGRWRGTGENANLCYGMLKSCCKGLIAFPLWMSHVHWSEFRGDTVEQKFRVWGENIR